VAALNLLRLARLTGRVELEAQAGQAVQAFALSIRSVPAAHAQFLVALDYLAGPSTEVVIAGNPEISDTQDMLGQLRRAFLPRTCIMLVPPDDDKRGGLGSLAEFTREMTPVNGQATAYVCRNFSCRKPTTDPAEMMAWLRE
jgi:hypothetical protein